MRISDWSSDVCSSDLIALMHTWQSTQTEGWWRIALDACKIPYEYISTQDVARTANLREKYDVILFAPGGGDRKSVVKGKSVSVRVDLGGRRFIKKKNKDDKILLESQHSKQQRQ